MTRFKRRLLIAGALVLVLAVGLVVMFQMFTRSALVRAESFKFRRMQV